MQKEAPTPTAREQKASRQKAKPNAEGESALRVENEKLKTEIMELRKKLAQVQVMNEEQVCSLVLPFVCTPVNSECTLLPPCYHLATTLLQPCCTFLT